ncbi:MAG: hypothetical protein PUE08_03935 [Eubacteriales bacterium]|nr:hypothetical protein [Eubacteriales bacterium]
MENSRSDSQRSNNRRTTGGNDKLLGSDLQKEGDSNKGRNAENGTYDYSTEEEYSIDVDTEVKDLRKENKKLKEVNELLRHEFDLTEGKESSLSSATAIARRIVKDYDSSLSGTELGKDIKAMVDRVMQDEFRNYDTLYSEAQAIAKKVVDSKKKKISPEAQEMINEIRSTPVKLSDTQKKEVAYQYGSYGAFYRENLGKIKITKKREVIGQNDHSGSVDNLITDDFSNTNVSQNDSGVNNIYFRKIIQKSNLTTTILK